MKTETNFTNIKINGITMIFVSLLLFAASIYSTSLLANNASKLFLIPFFVLLFAFILAIKGFVLINPNEACAMVWFGKYEGTIKENGFFWTIPFYSKQKLSQRAHNLDVKPIKVNDKMGNPVMIGLVLVWKIEDTYKALFEIEADVLNVTTTGADGRPSLARKKYIYDNFVQIQSDAALRKIAGLYAYDNDDHEHTLRSGGDEITEQLERELRERLKIAGIQIIEARINYLAYAAEIASVMLRRQQAAAIISAREKIVEGAVSMVKLALDKLSEGNVVELDDDKKAAMVSNLMVVLCADESVQPVINTGSLYQ